MISDMGKLLFVNTSRINGIFGLVVCAGTITAGLWFGLSGACAGLLLLPAGLFAGKFCLKMANLRTELYEQGFVSKNAFGGASGRYGELKSISGRSARKWRADDQYSFGQAIRRESTKLTSEVARELCQRAGSKAFIAGAIGNLGSKYVLGLKAMNCQNGSGSQRAGRILLYGGAADVRSVRRRD
jgi:hypothetical protein